MARGGLSQIAGPEFDDFAAPYWIDEASTSPLLGNAKKIAESMTWPKSKHKVLKELVGDSEPEDDKVMSAITFTFQLVLGRQPTEEELPRFFRFLRKGKGQGRTRHCSQGDADRGADAAGGVVSSGTWRWPAR